MLVTKWFWFPLMSILFVYTTEVNGTWNHLFTTFFEISFLNTSMTFFFLLNTKNTHILKKAIYQTVSGPIDFHSTPPPPPPPPYNESQSALKLFGYQHIFFIYTHMSSFPLWNPKIYILKNAGNQMVLVPIDFHCIFVHTMKVKGIIWLPTFFKISSFVFHRRRKKISQLWEGSKFLKNFHFGGGLSLQITGLLPLFMLNILFSEKIKHKTESAE